jgi:hypothetical protein
MVPHSHVDSRMCTIERLRLRHGELHDYQVSSQTLVSLDNPSCLPNHVPTATLDMVEETENVYVTQGF